MQEKLYWRVDGYYEVVWKERGSHLAAKRFRFTSADWLNNFSIPGGRAWPEGLPKAERADLDKARRLAAHRMRGHGYGAAIEKRKGIGKGRPPADPRLAAMADGIIADGARKQSLARYYSWERIMKAMGRKASPSSFSRLIEERKKSR